ncbi:hypothetical protein [Kribbella solani]|uniref:hypothetical protein n=1 Tax=Kribbella solani TaxID=236067 RepID=UPI0029C061E3|nr:hypothetical protein [Kribbella solani]
MPSSYSQSSAGDPSIDALSELVIETVALEARRLGMTETGRLPGWADAAMHGSALASGGEEADLFNGLAERLGSEYTTQNNVGHRIDNRESLPNVRADVAQDDIDQALRRIATAIVEDHQRTSRRPDPDQISAVREAMAQRLAESRFGNLPADGPGTYGTRLGRETAEAGITAMKQVLREESLAHTVEHTLGAQAAPGTAPSAAEQNGNTSHNPAAAVKPPKSTGLGGRG